MSNRWKNVVVRLSVMGASLAMLAACQTTSPYSTEGKVEAKATPNFPTRLDSAPPNTRDTQIVATAPPAPVPPPVAAPVRQPADDPNPPAPARPSGAVESQPLAPLAPPSAPVQQPEPQVVAAPPPPAPAPVVAPPPPPPAPTYREIATGPVIETDGPPASHTVKRGETLSSIARAMDTTVKDLQTRNKLGNSSTIRPGQRIKGPSRKVKAYVVQQGDTLAAIGRRFNVTTAQLTRANGLPSSGAIRPTQRLILPSGYRDSGPQRIEIAASNAPVSAPVTPPPARTAPPSVAATPPSVAANPPPSRPVASLPPPRPAAAGPQGRSQFIWPVEGRVISSFGARGPGQKADGIDIAAPEGAEVKAVASGTVSFVGPLDESPELGTLLLIENGSGYYSIYGHLSSTEVRLNQRVTQGQTIGRVGRTGIVSEPQLYLELRHHDTPTELLKPVDPIGLLPPR